MGTADHEPPPAPGAGRGARGTRIDLVGALDAPTAGSVRLGRKEVAGATRAQRSAIRRHTVSFVFQSFNLFPALNAVENVQLGADVAGRPDARGVAGRLLADEPTGELDFRTGVQILELLRAQAGEGKTVVVVTHNREISRVSDRVVELSSGRVVADGPPVGGRAPVTALAW